MLVGGPGTDWTVVGNTGDDDEAEDEDEEVVVE